MKRVAVVGAAGKVGRLTVAAAIGAGLDTVAVARDPDRVPDCPGPGTLRRVRADILDEQSVVAALRGVDAVITTFGAPLTLDTVRRVPDICKRGTRSVLAGMQHGGVSRLVCMTAIGVGDSRGQGRWIFRNVIQPVLLQRIFVDRERQEELVRASNVQWTIVRPAELTDGPHAPVHALERGTTHDHPPTTISRASVAEFLVREVEHNQFVSRWPVISN